MKKIALATILATLLAGSAQAVQFFDFSAQAVIPADVGGTAAAYGVILNGGAPESPLPLDVANYQYTLVVTGLTMVSSGAPSVFSGGTVAIYEDAATPADYADPGTFSDGVLVLGGVLNSLTSTMLLPSLGSGNGYVDWNSGARLDDLAPEDQSGWPFLVTVYTDPSVVEPGYSELWDGKVEPGNDVVDTDQSSWSEVKALFR